MLHAWRLKLPLKDEELDFQTKDPFEDLEYFKEEKI
jgi:hypothetical protein